MITPKVKKELQNIETYKRGYRIFAKNTTSPFLRKLAAEFRREKIKKAEGRILKMIG